MKFNGNKHNFFCRCSSCKQKRRNSLLYPGALICFIAFGAAGSYGMDLSHTVEMDVIMGLMTVLAIYRHRANISRLLKGTENKLGAAKTASK